MWSDSSLWFAFAFPWWLVMLSIFSCTYWLFTCLLWRNVYSNTLPIFQWGLFLFWGDFFCFVLGVFFCLCYWVVGANLISSYPWLCILLSWPLAWFPLLPPSAYSLHTVQSRVALLKRKSYLDPPVFRECPWHQTKINSKVLTVGLSD